MRLTAHKYRAKPTMVDGIRFASRREAQRYQELKLLEKAGQITDLKLQPRYEINWFKPDGMKHICYVKLDFEYMQNGRTITEDVKGFDTDLSRLKRKLVEAFHGVHVEIVK